MVIIKQEYTAHQREPLQQGWSVAVGIPARTQRREPMDYPHIVKTPDTCNGLPRIDGTRITVNLIVREVVRARRLPEEVLIAHPHLTLLERLTLMSSVLLFYYNHHSAVN